MKKIIKASEMREVFGNISNLSFEKTKELLTNLENLNEVVIYEGDFEGSWAYFLKLQDNKIQHIADFTYTKKFGLASDEMLNQIKINGIEYSTLVIFAYHIRKEGKILDYKKENGKIYVETEKYFHVLTNEGITSEYKDDGIEIVIPE